MIELKNVSKTLFREKIFENVSLRVGNGECAAVVCEDEDKRIIITSIMSGAMGISDGAVLIGGYNVARYKIKAAKQLAVVCAEGVLYDELNVQEFLFFVAEAKGVPYERINAKVKDAIDICSIGRYSERLMGSLPHSVRRRVLLAQALLAEVSVLIICESATEVDSQTRQIFENVILGLTEKGVSVVIVCSEDSSYLKLSKKVYKIRSMTISALKDVSKEDDEE